MPMPTLSLIISMLKDTTPDQAVVIRLPDTPKSNQFVKMLRQQLYGSVEIVTDKPKEPRIFNPELVIYVKLVARFESLNNNVGTTINGSQTSIRNGSTDVKDKGKEQ